DGDRIVVVTKAAAVGRRHVLRGADGGAVGRHRGGHIGEGHAEAGGGRAAVGVGGGDGHRVRAGLVARTTPAPTAALAAALRHRATGGADGHAVVVVTEAAAVG